MRRLPELSHSGGGVVGQEERARQRGRAEEVEEDQKCHGRGDAGGRMGRGPSNLKECLSLEAFK